MDLKSKNSLGLHNEPRLRSRILYSNERLSSQVLYSENNIQSLETSNDNNFELKIPIRRVNNVYRSFTVLSNKAIKKNKSKRTRKVSNKQGFLFHFLGIKWLWIFRFLRIYLFWIYCFDFVSLICFMICSNLTFYIRIYCSNFDHKPF